MESANLNCCRVGPFENFQKLFLGDALRALTAWTSRVPALHAEAHLVPEDHGYCVVEGEYSAAMAAVDAI